MRSIRFPKITRRRFFGFTAAAMAGLGGYTYLVEPHWLKIVERDLAIVDLPPSLDQRTLVQISDLHVGPVSSDYLIEALKSIDDLRPDMVVITGDFMSCDSTGLVDEVCRVMRRRSCRRSVVTRSREIMTSAYIGRRRRSATR